MVLFMVKLKIYTEELSSKEIDKLLRLTTQMSQGHMIWESTNSLH